MFPFRERRDKHLFVDSLVDLYMFTTSEAFKTPPELHVGNLRLEARLLTKNSVKQIPGTLKPYRLCTECRAFCESLQTFTVPHRFPHYADGSMISRSARSGCHLCSIVLHRLRYTPAETTQQKWIENNQPIDSVVDKPKLEHKHWRSQGKLVLDFHRPDDIGALDRLNVGSVILQGTTGMLFQVRRLIGADTWTRSSNAFM